MEAERQRNQAVAERARALTEKARAEENYRAARDVVERFTRLGEELSRTAGAEETGRIVLEQSLTFFDHLLKLESADPSTSFQTAMAHYRAARIQYDLGHLQPAENMVGQAIALLTQLTRDFPLERDYRFLLAHARSQAALIQRRMGNREAAGQAFSEAVALGDGLVGDFPSEDRFKSLAATARIHWLVVAEGVTTGERERHLRQAISLLEEVSAQSPEQAWATQDLALGKEHLAMAQWGAGRLQEARDLLKAAIDLRDTVSMEIGGPPIPPGHDAGLPQSNLMDAVAMENRRRLDAARARAIRTIIGNVTLLPPLNRHGEASFYKARNLYLLGRVVEQCGDVAAAEEHLRAANELAKSLYISPPKNFEYALLMATCHATLANNLAKQSRAVDAVATFSVAAQQLRQLRRNWKPREHGDVLIDAFMAPDLPFDSTDQEHDSSLRIAPTTDDLRHLVEVTSSEPSLQIELAQALIEIFKWLRALDDPEGMDAVLRQTITLRQQALEASPDDVDRQIALAEDLYRFAFQLDRWDRKAEAIEWLRRSVDVREQLAKKQPGHRDWTDRLNQERALLADLSDQLGDSREALELYRASLDLDPNDAQPNNSLAWFLVTCKDVRYRNPHEAVRLAERAVELAPDRSIYWNTLGAAYYRSGRYDKAIRTIGRAIELNGRKPTVDDLLFLSMSEYQRGDHQAAREHFDAAIAWQRWHEQRSSSRPSNPPGEAVLIQEARELLADVLRSGVQSQEATTDRLATLRLDDSRLHTMASVSGEQLVRQDMGQFGPSWSEDSQLWWLPSGAGARLKLIIHSEQSGEYSVVVNCTLAHNYGQFQLFVNGQRVGERFEGFNPGKHPDDVIHSGRVTLGRAQLSSGANTFVFEVVGKNASSAGYMVGIDDLELVPHSRP
jgi:tetratricopeptide (TPR) repeat protein